MNPSVQKHLALILDWIDKGFSSGAHKAKFDIDELKKKARELAIALAAAVGAFAGATIALFKFIEMGAKMKDTADTFQRVREKAGLLPDTLQKIREASHGTISDMDLMKSSAAALANGLDPSRLVEFWAKAKQISAVSGVPTRDVFEALALAITKLNTMNLTATGITIRTDDAFENYARAIGKATAELTSHDKQMAISIELEDKYRRQFAALGDITSGAAERFEQIGTGVKNLKDKFLMMLGSSPGVETFLVMIISKIGSLSDSLDNAEPIIVSTTEKLINFYHSILDFDETRFGKAIDYILRYKEQIAGLAVALAAGEITSRLTVLGVAMGLLSKVGAAGWGIIIGGTAGTAATMIMQMREAMGGTDELNISLKTEHAILKQIQRLNIYDINSGPWKFIDGRIAQIEELNRVIQETGGQSITLNDQLARMGAQGLAGFKFPFGVVPPGPPENLEDLWKNAPGKPPQNLEMTEGLAKELLLKQAFANDEVNIQLDKEDRIKVLRSGRTDWEMQCADVEFELARRSMEERQELYQRGFAAMGMYSYKFFSDSMRRSRTLNAMLIVGFGEVLASYIESKAKQAGMDAMEYAYQALVCLARGNFGGAAAFGVAAAKAAALAGVGLAIAGGMRYEAQQKAEAISAQEEQQGSIESSSGRTSIMGQRKQATGIVNTRPISIVVNSNTYFQSGYNIFGDSEAAVNDFYDGKIREKIEGDIESGMIAIPA